MRGASENTWWFHILVLPPALCALGVAAVWGVYASRVSGKPGLDRASIFGFGFGSIAGWFALAALAIFAVPWMGNAYVAVPNPLGLLAAAGLGFVNTWFCSKGLARTLDRGPTPDLVSWLLFATLGSCVAVSEYRGASEREVNEGYSRGMRVAQSCQSGNLEYDEQQREVRHEGCFELGERTRKGEGVERDEAAAADIYQWGCEQASELSSCAALAMLYESGQGVAIDLAKAVRFYGKACNMFGPPPAFDRGLHPCVRYARMHAEGLGVPKDPSQAVILLGESCGRDAAACTEAGRMLQGGRGVERDAARAAAFFKRACDLNDTDACAELQRLAPGEAK